MAKRAILLSILAFAAVPLSAQAKPSLVVDTFTQANGLNWPYEMKQMQLQTVTELKIKDGATFEVVAEIPKGNAGKAYILDGEVLEWHPGVKAE